MSIYDKASLVLIPSGTKTSKVYSQKPVSGDGDFTFSRSTAATRVNASGNIEKETQNLLLQSNSFNTTWLDITLTKTSGQAGYDGTNDAWKLDCNAASSRLYQTSLSVSNVQTFSVYAKAGTLNYMGLIVAGAGAYAYFDIANGQLGATNVGTIDHKIESIGGGWYRCSIAYTGTTTAVRIYPAQGDNDTAQTSGNIYIQDAQLEQGLVARDVITTTTTAIYGGITDNVPRLDYTDSSCPALLLEPQRTNLVVNSEYANSTNWSNGGTTYSNNQATSPEGVDNAIKLIEDNSTSFHYLGSDISGVTTTGTYSISGFIKKGTRRYGGLRAVTNGYVNRYFVLVDLDDGSVVDTHTQGSGVTWSYDVQDYGSGWYRVEISGAHTSGTIGGTFSPSDTDSPTYFGALPDYDGSTGEHIFCYGLQAELGSYATSYIPTYGSAVTRNVDLCNKTSATSIIGQTEGTIFIEGKINADNTDNFNRIFGVSQGNDSYRIIIFSSNQEELSMNVKSAGTTQAQIASTISPLSTFKAAIGYATNDFVFYVNGQQIGTDNSGSVPACHTISLGTHEDGSGTRVIEGDVNQAMLFKTRLTNAELADLTTL